jgi:hypothetical protein
MKTAKVSRSHGLPLSILNQQAQKMGLPLEEFRQLSDYEVKFIAVLKMLKAKYDLEAAVLVILICNRTKIGKIKYVPPHR